LKKVADELDDIIADFLATWTVFFKVSKAFESNYWPINFIPDLKVQKYDFLSIPMAKYFLFARAIFCT
jgi:hypothetical protein